MWKLKTETFSFPAHPHPRLLITIFSALCGSVLICRLLERWRSRSLFVHSVKVKWILETQPFHWVTSSGKDISHLRRGGMSSSWQPRPASAELWLTGLGERAWQKSVWRQCETFPWLERELSQFPKCVNTSADTFSVAQPIPAELYPIHCVQWDHPGAEVLPEMRKCFTVCLAMERRPDVK